jgi:hypothetical protein
MGVFSDLLCALHRRKDHYCMHSTPRNAQAYRRPEAPNGRRPVHAHSDASYLPIRSSLAAIWSCQQARPAWLRDLSRGQSAYARVRCSYGRHMAALPVAWCSSTLIGSSTQLCLARPTRTKERRPRRAYHATRVRSCTHRIHCVLVGRSNHMSKMSTACKLLRQLLPTGAACVPLSPFVLCQKSDRASARDVGGETVSSSVVWSRPAGRKIWWARCMHICCMQWQCCRLIWSKDQCRDR